MPDLLRISIHDIRQGAILNGRGGQARRIMRHVRDESEEEAAEWGLAHIRRHFHTHFKEPTGYYESRVHISNSSAGHKEITDGGEAGPVYGPWLEGVGSRNATSRFKGYWSFRTVASLLEQRYERIGESVLRRWINRL